MSAVDTAINGIRARIASGELAPGDRLPNAEELCSALGVSRSSVREAVSMLSALGVLEARHGSGTYVSALRPEDVISGLSITVDLLPLDALLELYELRRLLEGHVSARAAARADADLDNVLGELTRAMEATDDGREASRLDQLFHEAIADAGGNPAIAALLRVLRARSRAYRLFDLPAADGIRAASDAGHRAITRAIAERDPVAAATAGAAHVAQTEAWLREYQPAAHGAATAGETAR